MLQNSQKARFCEGLPGAFLANIYHQGLPVSQDALMNSVLGQLEHVAMVSNRMNDTDLGLDE